MKFTEAKLEKAFTELLGNEGYPHHLGITIKRPPEEVLIEEDLQNFLLNQYKEEGITVNEVKSIILNLKSLPASDLYESNKKFIRMVSDGFILKREDRNQKDIYIQLIDYKGLNKQKHAEPEHLINIVAEDEEEYGKDNNIYKFVNQLETTGTEKRILDGIIYINGLPLVVFEFKTAIKEDCTIHDAYVQLTTRYKRDIPELFKYNAFCVISDGVNNKAGSFFAPYEFFYAWRRNVKLRLREKDSSVNTQLKLGDSQGISSMYTMIEGMFNKNTLRDIIRNFIYIPDSSKKNEKIVCRYPQYYAARALFESIKKAQKPEGDGKGGTYFGATGCGKSFTMLFLTRLLMKSEYFESPTIILITDRTDLDDQLSGQFTNAKIFIGDNTVVSVESRAHLRELIQGRQSGGVFLTTIHKFTEDTELLTERTNVICISDEAHRSQVNLDQKIKVTKNGVKKTYGFAKYLHDSLPNATFVGFTGTPIDATLDVFGRVVDAYTMTESVKDEITVRIVYEGRAAKVALNNSELEKIEKYYQEVAEAGANEYQIEQSKEETAKMNAILRDSLKIMLASLKNFIPFKVQEAESVEDALIKVNHNHFDIAIIDYQMPGISGVETIHRILRSKPKMKILALSNYDELSYIQSMRDAGAHGYVLKNIEPEEMLKAIKAIQSDKIYYCNDVAAKLIECEEGKLSQELHLKKTLTKRETQVLKMIAMEMTNDEIAVELYIAKRTIDSHRQNLINKLHVKNTAGLIRKAFKFGLIEE